MLRRRATGARTRPTSSGCRSGFVEYRAKVRRKPAAASGVSVDSALTCNTRVKARTRSEGAREVAGRSRRSGTGCHIRSHHLLRVDDAVEFGLRDESQLQGGGLEREIISRGIKSLPMLKCSSERCV